ncbi:MAG TPA: pitrilysin family protein [Vicinamibacterales bacterium]
MIRRLSAAAVVCAFAAAVAVHGEAPAQQGNPAKAAGTVLKGRAPVNKDVLKVSLPKAQEADLSNGVHLIVVEDHRAPQVFFQMLVDGAGGYYDPPAMAGLAGFTAALMREGTTTKSSEQVSEVLDRLAAAVAVGAGASSAFATVSGNGLTANLDTVLSLMADVLMNPSFPQAEIDRYKARTKAAFINQRTQPGFLAQERLSQALFGDHPLSRVAPTPAALDALSREALVEFHKAHYVPDRAILAVAGDISLEQAKTKSEAVFGGWQKSGASIAAQTAPASPAAATVSFVARPGSVQTSLRVGTQSLERTNADYDALTVANRVLGGGPTGRLFSHLREEKGYTYGAYSSFNATRVVGSWSASTDVRSEVTDPALTDLLDEIRQMRAVPVPDKELADTKKALVAGFALSLESPNAILNNYIERYIYKLPADYWDTYPSRIEAITAADVQRVASKYWAADRLQVVAVGDQSKVEPALKKLGVVQAFGADGKPIK